MNFHTEAPYINPTLKRRFLARKQTAKGLCGNSQRTLRYRCLHRKPLPPGSDSNREKDFAEKIKATSRPDWKPTKPRPLPVPPAAARLAKVIHFSQPEKPPGRRGFSVMRWLLLYGVQMTWGGEMFISEQINRTRAKSQQIVVQDYSHAYNTPFFI